MLSFAVTALAYPHPGGLVTGGELGIIQAKVDNGVSPWAEAYSQMMVDANQALSVTSHAIATLNIPGYYANPDAHDAAKLRLEIDSQSSYAAAVAYRLTGETVYAEKAKELLNGWSYTNTGVAGTDGRLVSAYVGVGLINAADLIKDYPGWSAADKTQFGNWLTGVMLPVWDSITFTSNWRDWSLYAQIASYQFLDDETAMASEVNQLKTQIDVSIREDGFLPDETTRGTNSLWYHYFALAPMTAAAEIVKNATGEDLYNWVSPNGKSIKLALDKMFYYVNGHVAEWPSAYGGGNQSFSNARHLYEAMADVYQDEDYEDYAKNSRPLSGRVNNSSGYYHHHAWVYPTLLRTSFLDTEADIIIDNPAAEYTGVWTASSFKPKKYGDDYMYSPVGSGENKMRWRPSIPSAGTYSVYYWLPDGYTGYSSNAPFTVYYDGGSETKLVNEQAIPGGTWKLLGTYAFAAGTAGYVELTNNANSTNVIGDAIKFVKSNDVPPPQTEYILDNGAAELTGTWTASSFKPNKYGTDYLYSAVGSGANKMRWRPALATAGTYSVYYWLPDGFSGYSSNAPFTVYYDGGSYTKLVNEQTVPGGSWKLLGSFPFTAGTGGYVELTNNANSTNVVGDAIKFVKN
jgi:hypothetical protein